MIWGLGKSKRPSGDAEATQLPEEPSREPRGRVWVGGATGFLGSHLARQLASESRKVVLTSKSGGEVFGQTVDSVDILDEEAVRKSAKGCSSAYLCAGRVSRDPKDAPLLHELHVMGTRAALAGLKKAGVERVVVASTSGVIAVGRDPDTIFDESAPVPMEIISSWPYYRSKYFAEREALSCNAADFEVVVVNPSLLLGPGDLRESSTEDVRRFLEKTVHATPAGGIALVDVRDAAAGMIRAMARGRPGERYLLSGANMTLGAFFARLSRISGVAAPRFSMPPGLVVARSVFSIYEKGLRVLGGHAPVDSVSVEMGQYFWYCSAEKAERELGFSPRDPGETLQDTVFDLIERKVVAPIEWRSRV